MSRTRRKTIEFRFYELPQSESVIGLAGEQWYGIYGDPERSGELHFHNLFEFGYCRYGKGQMFFRGAFFCKKTKKLNTCPAL